LASDLFIDAWGREFDAGGLGTAAVADGELVGWVGWEEFGYVAEAFGEGLRGEEGVLALAELGVVEVD
jgi:hypothetical protein